MIFLPPSFCPRRFLLFSVLSVASCKALVLAWDPSPTPNVTYNLYYGPAHGFYTNVINCGTNCTYRLPITDPLITDYFAVTAQSSTGIESAFSNEISVTNSPIITNLLITVSVESALNVIGPWLTVTSSRTLITNYQSAPALFFRARLDSSLTTNNCLLITMLSAPSVPSCKKPARAYGPRPGICALLVFIGLPRARIYAVENPRYPGRQPKSFWLRNAGQLHFLLRDAELAFRRAIKVGHPDARGTNQRAADLTRARTRIRHLFKLHGATLALCFLCALL